MKNSGCLHYMGVFAVGIILILAYMKFISYYKELSSTEENFIYTYTDSDLPEGIAEECHKYQIDCEIWNIGKEKALCAEGLTRTADGYVIGVENGILKELYLNRGGLSCVVSSKLAYLLFGTETMIGEKIEYRGQLYEVKKLISDRMPILFLSEEPAKLENENKDYPDENDAEMTEGENKDYPITNKENILEGKMSIAMVKGIEALDYHETENLFSNSDFIIDVNLLKWIVYMIIFFCFFCVMLFCLCQNKNCGNKRWLYFVVMLIWFLYVKIFIFAGTEDFPVWVLPGKWSDIEGWGNLGEEALKQLSYVIHFKDYPIICQYYEGVIKSIFYLFLSLILAYLFFKSSFRLRHFWAVHMAMTVIAFAAYSYCSDKDRKALIYFLPCFIGSFLCREICQEKDKIEKGHV